MSDAIRNFMFGPNVMAASEEGVARMVSLHSLGRMMAGGEAKFTSGDGGRLTLDAGKGDDEIHIRNSHFDDGVVVTVNGESYHLSREEAERLVIKGGKGDDQIVNDSDVGIMLNGDDGNDEIRGGKGNDLINGGKGDDVIDGGEGNDWVDGGAGDDEIDGGKGDDKIYGYTGNDAIDGGAGNDYLSGGKGDDVIDGGKGNDRLRGGTGNDEIDGGTGKDKIDAPVRAKKRQPPRGRATGSDSKPPQERTPADGPRKEPRVRIPA